MAVLSAFQFFPRYSDTAQPIPKYLHQTCTALISLRYYLDTRRPSSRPDGKFPLKLAVSRHGSTALLPVLAYATREEWDPKLQQLKGGRWGDAGKLNQYLAKIMMRAEDLVRDMVLSEDVATMTAVQIRDRIAEKVMDAGVGLTLGEYYDKVAAEKKGGTRTQFARARAAFEKGVPRIMDRPLSSITERDVAKIDANLRKHVAHNTRNTYISKLTQVLKRAHREGLVSADAGRDIKLKMVTTRSRDLTLEQLRVLFALEPETELGREALDFFRLSFYLRAINPVDLLKATPDQVFNGRLMYERSKTGKDYSVKVEPEAQAIMDRRSDDWRIWAPGRFRDPHNYPQDLNDELRKMSKAAGLPTVTMYWARHTFATLMVETGTPIETVAAALGHSYGPKVTMGYVSIREKAVDEATRRLYDYVAGTWVPSK